VHYSTVRKSAKPNQKPRQCRSTEKKGMENQAPTPGKRPNDDRMFKVPAPVLAVFTCVEDGGDVDGKASFDARRLRICMKPLPPPFPPDCDDEKTLNEVGGVTPPSLALRAIPGRRNVDLFEDGARARGDCVDRDSGEAILAGLADDK